VDSAASTDSSDGVAGESPPGSAPTMPAASTVPHSAAQSDPSRGAGETNPGMTSGTTDIVSGGSSVPPTAAAQGGQRPVTRLQKGISKPKVFTDGTVRWL
jgi:hypothetical protein